MKWLSRSSNFCPRAGRNASRLSLCVRVFGALAVLAIAFQPACALDPARTLAQYLREEWHSDRGFPGGSVTAIAQTSDGYLWIGTEHGLVRFDGMSFRSFSVATPTTFAITPVQALVADAHNNLWVVLKSTKVLHYQDGKFELGRDTAENAVTAAAKAKDGTALFSSLALGILTYRNGKYEIATANNDGQDVKNPLASSDVLSTHNSWATGN